ncbi:hypothetical protein [Roseicyclus mahoneyensis]|uniref:Uncharacterized protein n=1 Tax=Roseicyclus mahoneyensis TaxID=164332 RepID=A0A316GFC7_9RHOB|nr:hypothetical protein [Roseicyclus mahoneyensis]PWK59313.1 hypothetical protein C7455_10881 [Roseicyclus mahoneyensis]
MTQELRFRAMTILLATATTTVPLAGAGYAQGAGSMICGQRAQIVGQLRARFGEQVRAVGLAGQTRIVEVFASSETGSWTITVTSVDGITCLMASGQHYEAIAALPAGEPM